MDFYGNFADQLLDAEDGPPNGLVFRGVLGARCVCRPSAPVRIDLDPAIARGGAMKAAPNQGTHNLPGRAGMLARQ